MNTNQKIQALIIIGPDGSGKSALKKLICEMDDRFYIPFKELHENPHTHLNGNATAVTTLEMGANRKVNKIATQVGDINKKKIPVFSIQPACYAELSHTLKSKNQGNYMVVKMNPTLPASVAWVRERVPNMSGGEHRSKYEQQMHELKGIHANHTFELSERYDFQRGNEINNIAKQVVGAIPVVKEEIAEFTE